LSATTAGRLAPLDVIVELFGEPPLSLLPATVLALCPMPSPVKRDKPSYRASQHLLNKHFLNKMFYFSYLKTELEVGFGVS
jgi:hypothetical protein